jgi:hypothetical protein
MQHRQWPCLIVAFVCTTCLDQDSERPLCADTVEKVENRTIPKISQMLIFGQLHRWDAP